MGAVLIGIAAFYGWSPTLYPVEWTRPQAISHYDFYTDAILAGELQLGIEPRPELIALSDPYDPVSNAPYRVNDVSYFEGRYYLYLGITPVLTLLAPFRAVTASYLTEQAATFIFCLSGLLALVSALDRWRRHYAQAAPFWLVPLFSVVLACGSGHHAILRSGSANQLPIAAAYAWAAVSLLLLLKGMHRSTHAAGWFAAASLAFGLAVSARPNFVFGAPMLLAGPLTLRHPGGPFFERELWRTWLAVALPVGGVVASLLALNFARFGDPLEFGQRLMLGGWDQRSLPSADLAIIWTNAGRYLWAPASYHSYFPFARIPSWEAVGLLRHVPLLWLLPFALIAFVRSRPESIPRTFLAAVAVIAGANLAYLLVLPSGNVTTAPSSANVRYVLDFQPYWILLTALAALTTASHWAAHRACRRILAGACLTTGLATVVFGLSFDLQRLPVESYRRFAEVINQPSHWLEHIQGSRYGPISATVRFPATLTGRTEALLSVGPNQDASVLYVEYPAPGRARFGLFNTQLGGPQGEVVALDPDRPYRLDVSMGALYPPTGSPALRTLEEASIAWLRRRVLVRLDDEIVLDTVARSGPADTDTLRLGVHIPGIGPATADFSGQIIDVSRMPIRAMLPEVAPMPAWGPLRMTLLLPRGLTGVQEPLVVSGVPQAGNFVYVRYVDDGHIQLGFDHWGAPGIISSPLAVDYGREHVIEIDFGALYPPPTDAWWSRKGLTDPSDFAARVVVKLNGQGVITANRSSYPAAPADVTIGVNSIGGSTCGYQFSGELILVERLEQSL